MLQAVAQGGSTQQYTWMQTAGSVACIAAATVAAHYALEAFASFPVAPVAVALTSKALDLPVAPTWICAALSLLPSALAAPGALFAPDRSAVNITDYALAQQNIQSVSVNDSEAVVSWPHEFNGVDEHDIYESHFNLVSNLASAPQVVNTATTDDQLEATTALVNGVPWIAYSEQIGSDPNQIQLSIGDADPVQLNPDPSLSLMVTPKLSACPSTNRVGLLFRAAHPTSGNAALYFAEYDSSGAQVGATAQQLNVATDAHVRDIAIDHTASGWNAVWKRDSDGLYFRPIGGSEVQILSDPEAEHLTIQTLANGNSIITYETRNGSFQKRAMVMEVDSAGAVVSAPQGLTTGYTSMHPSVAVDQSGNQVLTFVDTTTNAVMVSLRSPDGAVQIAPEPIPGATFTNGEFPIASIDQTREGHLVLSWQDPNLRIQQINYAYLHPTPGATNTVDYDEVTLTSIPNQQVIASSSEITITYRIPTGSGRLTTDPAGGVDPNFSIATGELVLTGPVAEVNAQLANLAFESRLGYFEDFDLWRQVGDPSDPLFIDEEIPMEGSNVNQPPVGTSPPPAQGVVGTSMIIPLNVSDPDMGDVISVVGFNFPDWLHQVSTTLQGTPTLEMDPTMIGYNLTDGQATSGPYSFSLEVDPRPIQPTPMPPEDYASTIAEIERRSNVQWKWFLIAGIPFGILGGVLTVWRWGKEIRQCCCPKDPSKASESGGELGTFVGEGDTRIDNPTFGAADGAESIATEQQEVEPA